MIITTFQPATGGVETFEGALGYFQMHFYLPWYIDFDQIYRTPEMDLKDVVCLDEDGSLMRGSIPHCTTISNPMVSSLFWLAVDCPSCRSYHYSSLEQYAWSLCKPKLKLK